MFSGKSNEEEVLEELRGLFRRVVSEMQGGVNDAVHGGERSPILGHVQFCVWSRSLVAGSVRTKLRELCELGLSIVSLFKFIEGREKKDLELPKKEFGVMTTAYGMTLLFDRPLLFIGELNRLALKEEEQSVNHQLYFDVLGYFVGSLLSASSFSPFID